MASTIKVDTITTPDGTGNIAFSRPIVADVSNVTGTLPAIDGSNLTGIVGGAWSLKSSGAIPASTETWNLTGITTTTKIIMTNLIADGTSSPGLVFRTSTNNGSSYDSGGSDYASDYSYGGSYGAPSYGRDSSASYGRISPASNIADGSASITHMSIEIWHPDVATKATTIHAQSQTTNTNVQWEEVWAARLAAGAVNAISIYSLTTGRSFTGNYIRLELN